MVLKTPLLILCLGPPALKRHSAEPFCIHKNLEIYTSQYNIGREVVQTWIQNGALSTSDQKAIQNINTIIIGPPFISLSEQTEKDVDSFIRGICPAGMGGYKISNSSSLMRNSEDFMGRLENNQEELHLIIHDDAHFGIAAGNRASKIIQFLIRSGKL